MTLPMPMKKPNVVPEASMYCPIVLMTPFVPAPKRKTVTVPQMKPMMAPTVPPIMAPIFSLSMLDGPMWPPMFGGGGILIDW